MLETWPVTDGDYECGEQENDAHFPCFNTSACMVEVLRLLLTLLIYFLYLGIEIKIIDLNIPSTPAFPLSAITLLAGFMMAESALIGRRIGFVGSAMSMMTTSAVSPTFSRTQMNLSDSIVRVLNEIDAGLMPTFVSWKKSTYYYHGIHKTSKMIINSTDLYAILMDLQYIFAFDNSIRTCKQTLIVQVYLIWIF